MEGLTWQEELSLSGLTGIHRHRVSRHPSSMHEFNHDPWQLSTKEERFGCTQLAY